MGYQVSSMTVAVSDSILLSSVSTSDFMIDGNDATGVTVHRQPRPELLASRRPPTAFTTSRSAAWSTSTAPR